MRNSTKIQIDQQALKISEEFLKLGIRFTGSPNFIYKTSTDTELDRVFLKILGKGSLSEEGIQERVGSKVPVILSGSFDVLHIGHVYYLRQVREILARRLNTSSNEIFLYVFLDDDNIIAGLKGKRWEESGGARLGTIPLEELSVRVCKLASLPHVDAISTICGSPQEIAKIQLELMRSFSAGFMSKCFRVIPEGESYTDELKLLTSVSGMLPFVADIPVIQTTGNIMVNFAHEALLKSENPYEKLLAALKDVMPDINAVEEVKRLLSIE